MGEQSYYAVIEEQDISEFPSETENSPNDDTPIDILNMSDVHFLGLKRGTASY